jgi:hypothetical protein
LHRWSTPDCRWTVQPLRIPGNALRDGQAGVGVDDDLQVGGVPVVFDRADIDRS